MKCNKCGVLQPQAEFDGYRKSCNDCELKRCRDYYQRNKHEIQERQNEYRLAHREEARINARAYYRRKTA